MRVGEGGWWGARAGVERSGAMGRWRWVVGCGGGLHGRRTGFKAKGEGLNAGGSERRPCVGPEGSEGMRGIRAEGSEGITRGRGERRGARGGGRCVDLAPGGLERRASLGHDRRFRRNRSSPVPAAPTSFWHDRGFRRNQSSRHLPCFHTAPGLPFLWVPSPSSMTIVFLVLALGILSFLMIIVVFLADLISVWSCRHLHCFHVAPWLPFLEVPSSPSSMTIVFLGVDTSCYWH